MQLFRASRSSLKLLVEEFAVLLFSTFCGFEAVNALQALFIAEVYPDLR